MWTSFLEILKENFSFFVMGIYKKVLKMIMLIMIIVSEIGLFQKKKSD